MSSVGSRRWSLDLSFIRKGRAQIVSPFTGRKESIAWSTKTYPAKLLPISFVECRMSGMGCEAGPHRTRWSMKWRRFQKRTVVCSTAINRPWPCLRHAWIIARSHSLFSQR